MAARGAIRAWTLTTMDLDLTGLSFRPQILDSGVAEHELRRTLRYGQLKRLRPGAYVRADHRDLNDRVARHALLVSAAVPALSAGAVISHTSAAVLHGLPEGVCGGGRWVPEPAPASPAHTFGSPAHPFGSPSGAPNTPSASGS